MAYDQQIAERTRTEGFFKHIEWHRQRGVLIKLYNRPSVEVPQTVSFESGTYDIDYDQVFPGFRQFVLTRKDAVKFMLNSGFGLGEIATIFRQIDGMQVVIKQI